MIADSAAEGAAFFGIGKLHAAVDAVHRSPPLVGAVTFCGDGKTVALQNTEEVIFQRRLPDVADKVDV